MYIPEEIAEISEDVDIDETEVDEETDEEADEDADEEAEEADDQAEPADLASAFDRLRQMDAEDTTDALGNGGDEEVDDGDIDDSGDGGEDEDAGGYGEPADDEGYADDRGSSDAYDPAQYQLASQGIVNSVNQLAIARARQQFEKEGIREFNMGDLYERTQDGRVVYRNPDDPNRPFSNRMEAQQWIDSFNKQVQQSLVEEAKKHRKEALKSAAPMLRLMEFAPVYDQMDPDARAVLDDLIEDHEVKLSNGKVIGYNCDLNKMAAKAYKLAEKYSHTSHGEKKKGTMKKSGTQKRPAMDIRSSGSSRTGSMDSEPQTMEQAFARLREINKGRK